MDTSGNGRKKHTLQFDHPPQRVISLVPSLTESLFDLGFGASVVGITDYCVNPPGAVGSLPRLGGTKNPRIADILALHPDLVLANQEENTLPVVEALEAEGVRVLVTFPQNVRQALDELWMLVGIYMDKMAAVRLETLELTVSWAEDALAGRTPVRYFCPIWREGEGDDGWWMTFNGETYASDVLRLMGGENVFAGRERRYPLEADLGCAAPEPHGTRDTRYPRVALGEIVSAQPEIILLPSEPFGFTEQHREQIIQLMPETPAVKHERVFLVDGSLVTWHGTRLARALEQLPGLFGAG